MKTPINTDPLQTKPEIVAVIGNAKEQLQFSLQYLIDTAKDAGQRHHAKMLAQVLTVNPPEEEED